MSARLTREFGLPDLEGHPDIAPLLRVHVDDVETDLGNLLAHDGNSLKALHGFTDEQP